MKGIALLMVLWVIVLLNIIALNFFSANRWNSASTRNLKEETLSYYLAMSGYQEAVNYILSDKDISFDFIDNEGNFWTDKENQPVTGKRQIENNEIDIRIVDEDAKININYVSMDRLRKLFEYTGIPEDSISEIVDSMLDWKDPDTEHHLSGAEDEYYEGLETPYKAKNSLFDVPEEIALVKGMKPEYIKGSEDAKPLIPLITTYGRGNININTVSKEIMELLGLNPFEIETVLKQRNKETGGFRYIPGELSSRGLNTTSSNNFRIEVIARMQNSSRSTRITAVINRQPSTNGFKLQTLYWRESAEDFRG